MQDEHDDIILDTESEIDDSVLADAAQGDAIKKLREKLKTAEKDRLEYLTNWQKDKADFVNARKRDEEQKMEMLKYAKNDLITQILPVIDTFDLAMKNTAAWELLPKEWRMGMESIAKQLLGVLEQNGVSKINPMGEPFDPSLHDAVTTVPVTEEDKDHTVTEVLQTGFSLNGKVLRPAKVSVGEFS